MPIPMRRTSDPRGPVLLLAVLAVAACGDDRGLVATQRQDPSCIIPSSELYAGAPGPDAIESLTNPTMTSPWSEDAAYLLATDRVIGLVVGGQPLAIPLNILWWHEIVNLDVAGYSMAVTHCPLTGSSMVFDRGPADDAEFGVSGLLFRNNLVMYDRNEEQSLWPQMARVAGCGARSATRLPMIAALEATWDGWRSLHPDTRVVSEETGHTRDYELYPYGDYDREDNDELLFDLEDGIDPRRPPKERVLGIPADSTGGIAFPFGALDALGTLGVVRTTLDAADVVVLWDGDRRTAMAYEPRAGGEPATLSVRDGGFVDAETGSVWQVDGLAVDGPRAGQRLLPVAEAYVAYWFAWAAFQPDAGLWEG